MENFGGWSSCEATGKKFCETFHISINNTPLVLNRKEQDQRTLQLLEKEQDALFQTKGKLYGILLCASFLCSINKAKLWARS
jgi:hypothetical protein